jgi:Dullard-like phosphatase family protein
MSSNKVLMGSRIKKSTTWAPNELPIINIESKKQTPMSDLKTAETTPTINNKFSLFKKPQKFFFENFQIEESGKFCRDGKRKNTHEAYTCRPIVFESDNEASFKKESINIQTVITKRLSAAVPKLEKLKSRVTLDIVDSILTPSDVTISSEQSSIEFNKSLGKLRTERVKDFHEYTSQCLELSKQILPPTEMELQELLSSPSLLKILEQKRLKRRILPNLQNYMSKLIVFDLDETLITCKQGSKLKKCEKILEIKINDDISRTLGINFRPNLMESLREIKKIGYHLACFTASCQNYADPIIDLIDPNNEIFSYRLYRDHCIPRKLENGQRVFIKDLRIFSSLYDLNSILIIDNSLISFSFQIDNGIPILPFYGCESDQELKKLISYLNYLFQFNCLPEVNKDILKINISTPERLLPKEKKKYSCKQLSGVSPIIKRVNKKQIEDSINNSIMSCIKMMSDYIDPVDSSRNSHEFSNASNCSEYI